MAKGKFEYWRTKDGLLQIAAWARDGLIDEQIAHNMGIRRSTLSEWKKRFSDIADALKKNKNIVDIEVENALYKRAVGYEYQETTIEIDDEGKKKVKKTTKQMAPETLAIIFFLKNRKPEDWRDKREVEVKGEISMTNALKAARERVIKNE